MSKRIRLHEELCVGCSACMVACMDQNDMLFQSDEGTVPHRRVYRLEDGAYPEARIRYASVACFHCDNPSCVAGCPTGALKKDDHGSEVYDQSLCIGCHSCALACPFGIPRYDRENKVIKCTQCHTRTELGLEPACVRVCQTHALTFEEE